MSNSIMSRMAARAIALSTIAAPSVALAEDDIFKTAQSRVVKVAEGIESIAYPAAIVAVMVLGFLAWKGQFPWGRAIAVALSIFVIGIASSVVKYFAEGNATGI